MEQEIARRPGQPTLFKPEYIAIAEKMSFMGATIRDLADAFQVNIDTIWTWRAAHPEFSEALKLGKQKADERVERSLYEKANGYTYDAVKIFLPYGSTTPVYAPYREHVPPSDVAGIFWLKNRDPAHWRDAWQLEHVTGKYVISDKPLDEETWIKERGATVIDGDEAIDVTPADRGPGEDTGER